MSRPLLALVIGACLLASNAIATADDRPGARDQPVVVDIDGVGPMLLVGTSAQQAAHDYARHTARTGVFAADQPSIEQWARSRKTPRRSFRQLRDGGKPLIAVQPNRIRTVLGGDRLSPGNRAVIAGIRRAGGEPVLLPPGYDHAAIPTLLRQVDHVVLLGGDDVHPELYGGDVTNAHQHQLNRVRDDYEAELIRTAHRMKMEMTGICRGCQIMNAALGGELYPDINKDGATAVAHNTPELDHDVEMEPGSWASKTFGRRVRGARSFHHAAVRKVAPGLRVTGRSPDGVVEAIESRDGTLRGYQFHPEVKPDHQRRLFSDIVRRARHRRKARLRGAPAPHSWKARSPRHRVAPRTPARTVDRHRARLRRPPAHVRSKPARRGRPRHRPR